LLAELGYGPAGSLPAGTVAWTWLAAAPNPGWNGSLAVPAEPDNDEYQLALAAPAPGFYDYAFRFSADGGQSWVSCLIEFLISSRLMARTSRLIYPSQTRLLNRGR